MSIAILVIVVLGVVGILSERPRPYDEPSDESAADVWQGVNAHAERDAKAKRDRGDR